MTMRILSVMVASVTLGCAAQPTQPTRTETPAPPAAPVALPPPAAPNALPTVAGDLRCISPVGAPHVFPLLLEDADGDRMSWTAVKDRPQGDLMPERGDAVASGDTIRVTYVPPGVDHDENWIRLKVVDARGGSTTVTLYVKNH
jgi:hypothetical protein